MPRPRAIWQGANYIAGAGAYTYNEPGRTWYMSVNTHF